MLFDDQQFKSALIPNDYEVMLANRCLEILNDKSWCRVFPEPNENDLNPLVMINEILEHVANSGNHGSDDQHIRAHALKDLVASRIANCRIYKQQIKYLTERGEDLEPVERSKYWVIRFLDDFILRQFIVFQDDNVEYVTFKINQNDDLQRRNTLLDTPKFFIWVIDAAIEHQIVKAIKQALEEWKEFKESE